MHTRYGVLVAMLVAVFVGVGCGDDDDETTTPAESAGPPTVEEWATQADEICAAGDAEIDQAAQETFGASGEEPSKADQEAFVSDTVLPNIQGQIDDLGALTPPEGADGEKVTEFLDTAQSEYDDLSDDPSAALDQNSFSETEKQAQGLGLEDCASG